MGPHAGRPDAGREVLTTVLAADPLRETTAVALARGLHAGGRRADALAVLDRTRAALADELGVDPGPELRRTRTQLLQDEPPAVRTTTPEALTSFLGRETDLARLHALVATARLVTITGPGGAGKTRLATEAVRDDPRRVAVAELAALTSGDQVAPTVLHAVGGSELALGERAAVDAVMSRLRATLAGSDTVLVLDNCEHLVDAHGAPRRHRARDRRARRVRRRRRTAPAHRAAEEAKDGPIRGQVAETAARLALAPGDAGRAAELLAETVSLRGALHLGDPDVVATRDGCGFTSSA